jgi:hypothetical protein
VTGRAGNKGYGGFFSGVSGLLKRVKVKGDAHFCSNDDRGLFHLIKDKKHFRLKQPRIIKAQKYLCSLLYF